MKRELEILRSIDHPKIAKFYECYQDEKNFHFVIEYCGGESLVDKIIKDKFIKENKVKRIFYDILRAVNHLHHRGICHRDLKPDNFIFSDKDDKSPLKMIDFGLSKNYLSEELNSLVGTPYYVAPELFSKQYDHRCDYWSLGCILYIMLVGKPPFYAKTDELIFQKIAKVEYNFDDERWKSISPEARILISKFLKGDPKKRLTAAEALNDPWFEDVNRQNHSVSESLVNKGVVRRLKEFRTGSDFQKEVIKLMVNIFDYKDEIQRLRHVFHYADYLNNGTINQEEMKVFFEQVGVPTSEKQISEIISSMHLREKGLITYSEFIAATVDREFYENDENLE